MRSRIFTPSFERGVQKAFVHLSGGCLFFGLLFLAVGCGKPRSAQHADVSGKVLFQGRPLPGGRVTFSAVKGGFSSGGNIEADGSYRINAPVGEVQIGVDNNMLRQQQGKRGGAAPKQMHHPKPPGAAEDERPLKGQWVNIPSQYKDPASSGLTYTVAPGTQNHDIELSANPAPAPGAPTP